MAGRTARRLTNVRRTPMPGPLMEPPGATTMRGQEITRPDLCCDRIRRPNARGCGLRGLAALHLSRRYLELGRKPLERGCNLRPIASDRVADGRRRCRWFAAPLGWLVGDAVGRPYLLRHLDVEG